MIVGKILEQECIVAFNGYGFLKTRYLGRYLGAWPLIVVGAY